MPQNEGGHAFRVTAIRLIDGEGKDVSADYLVNYQNIQRCDRAYVRYGQPLNWQVSDFYIPNGNDGTKQGIDNYPGYDCLMLGVWSDAKKAEGNLADARLYRQVTLPAGRYYFCASYEAVYQLKSAYMFAATVPDASASALPPTAAETPATALAFYALPGTPTGDDFYGITFTLERETSLYLGWNADLTTPAQQEFRVKALRLLRDTQYTPDGIGEMNNEKLTMKNGTGTVYDLNGRRVSHSTAHSALPRGLYIVNGQKVSVK